VRVYKLHSLTGINKIGGKEGVLVKAAHSRGWNTRRDEGRRVGDNEKTKSNGLIKRISNTGKRGGLYQHSPVFLRGEVHSEVLILARVSFE